jgi:hypothetical protein
MKKLSVLLVAALTTAAVISLDWQPASFEERAIELQLDHAPPGLSAALQDETLEVKAVVLDYVEDRVLLLKAQAALTKYPRLARAVLPLYGDTPEFKEILAAHGESVLPPIYYFMNNNVTSVTVAHYAGQKIKAIKVSANRLLGAGQKRPKEAATPAANPTQKTQAPPAPDATSPLTPEQRGWYAVNYIRAEGHDFLGQFVIDGEGNPKWNQTERVVEGAGALFTSGIRDLETKLQTDQTLTAGDVGWAAVDAFAALGAVKLLRIGRAAAVSGETIHVSTRTAALTSRVARGSQLGTRIAQHGKWPAIAIAAYIALRHPSIIGDALVEIATLLDLPAWLGLLVGWMLILLPVLYIGTWILHLIVRPTTALLNALQGLLSWLDRPKEKTRAILDLRGSHRPVMQNDFLT